MRLRAQPDVEVDHGWILAGGVKNYKILLATPRLENTSSPYETMNKSSYCGVIGSLSWRVLEGSTAVWSAHCRGVC